MSNAPKPDTWTATKRDYGNQNWPIVITSSELHGLDPLTGENVVAVVSRGHKDRANLIEAAPDLLAVCQAVAEHFADTDAPLSIAARAAIAKATAA